MKCTQCGCKELSEIALENIFDVSILEGHFRPNKTLSIYICEECGHLEFFDEGIKEKLKERDF